MLKVLVVKLKLNPKEVREFVKSNKTDDTSVPPLLINDQLISDEEMKAAYLT